MLLGALLLLFDAAGAFDFFAACLAAFAFSRSTACSSVMLMGSRSCTHMGNRVEALPNVRALRHPSVPLGVLGLHMAATPFTCNMQVLWLLCYQDKRYNQASLSSRVIITWTGSHLGYRRVEGLVADIGPIHAYGSSHRLPIFWMQAQLLSTHQKMLTM